MANAESQVLNSLNGHKIGQYMTVFVFIFTFITCTLTSLPRYFLS